MDPIISALPVSIAPVKRMWIPIILLHRTRRQPYYIFII